MIIDNFGTIFLSHASADKSFVEKVYEKLDATMTFYDVKTINPGESFINAMKSGTTGNNIFVLFHSPSTIRTWVEYETDLAEINHADLQSKILVVPIKNETYRTAPKWMQGHMTCPDISTPSDITRHILCLQHDLLASEDKSSDIFVGREQLVRSVQLKALKNTHATGTPLQHLILAGLPGMGRQTLAKKIIESAFKNMRRGGPVFDLPEMADAIDFYLAMRQDIFGRCTVDEISQFIEHFNNATDGQKASLVLELCDHWASQNQPIIIKTKLGLRGVKRQIKPWLLEFFSKSKEKPSLRIIYISERRLPDDAIAFIPNVSQFKVEELPNEDIQYILSELIESRHYDSRKAEQLSENIHGHPATAYYASELVNSGRQIDSLNENSDPIHSFQESIVKKLISSSSISENQRKIISILSIFPKLSLSLIAKILQIPRKDLAQELWDLQENSLILAADAQYYSTPRIVSSRSRKELKSESDTLIQEVGEILSSEVERGEIDSQLIDAILISISGSTGEIPNPIKSLITPSSLLAIVRERFFTAREKQHGSKEVFTSAYNLSKLALDMNATDDAVEEILFTGGDSAIRAGINPDDILTKMTNSAMPSVYYLKGSYSFYVDKNPADAVKHLRTAMATRYYRLRNTRLLARALIRNQDFSGALDVLNTLTSSQLERETGLIIQKIRALRGARKYSEAKQLEQKIAGRDDEYGEAHLYSAGRALSTLNYDEALEQLAKAEKCQKVNRFTLDLLKCAVLLEKGDSSLLPLMVETSASINRSYDGYQLQARHAVVDSRWQDAEAYLDKIIRKDFFDLQIEQRMLKIKMQSFEVRTNPIALQNCVDRLEEIARLSLNSPEGYRDA